MKCRLIMIAKKISSFFIISALVLSHAAIKPNILKNFPLSSREITIAVGSIFGTAGIVGFISNKYHPASLEKKQLLLAAQEKNKQEEHAQAIKNQKIAQEQERKNALQELEDLQRGYIHEVALIQDSKSITQKTLIEIIRKKYNVHQTPINHYYHTLINDLEKLRKVNDSLPTEKTTERALLLQALEHLKENYNLLLGEIYKNEQINALYKKRIHEAEERKIEKEKLELEKLKIKVDNSYRQKTVLAQIQVQQELIKSKLDHLLKIVEQNLVAHELDELRKKQIETCEEIKKCNQNIQSQKSQQSPTWVRPPAYNPEYGQTHYSAPSAPPL